MRLKAGIFTADDEPMRAARVAVIAVIVFAFPASASDAAVGWHTKSQAERNIMAAHRVLARWNVGLVSPKTRLPKNNVWVRCAGRGARSRAGFTSFRCTIGYRRVRVRVTYLSKTKNGFELHDRRVYRV